MKISAELMTSPEFTVLSKSNVQVSKFCANLPLMLASTPSGAPRALVSDVMLTVDDDVSTYRVSADAGGSKLFTVIVTISLSTAEESSVA